jgi:hypothetical protein
MLTTTTKRLNRHLGRRSTLMTILLEGLHKKKLDSEPLPFVNILEILWLDDTLFCCRAEPRYEREWRLFAVWSARRVLQDAEYLELLDIAEWNACGQISRKALRQAYQTALRLRDEKDQGDSLTIFPADIAAWALFDFGAEAAFRTSRAVIEYLTIQAALAISRSELLNRSVYEAERLVQERQFRRVVTGA